jgi:sugar lactone lactonase YvrE
VKLAIKLKKMLSTNCNLGEGLWVKHSKAAWVDINRDQLLVYEGDTVRNYFTLNKPSIVYDIKNSEVSIGTDRGLSIFNITNKKEVLLSDISSSHNVKEFRSNDGGFCGNHQLLSFMHRNDSVNNLGFVYLVKDESFCLLDGSLHIPNSFIELEPSKILISDSLQGQIWLYKLDEAGDLVEKTLWAQLDKGIAPDGGCLVGDFVFVALWDGASIAVFDKNGTLIKKLPLPIIRPTNCKYDVVRSQLWVTSASEDLSKEQLIRYPLSGNTFVYNLELGSSC